MNSKMTDVSLVSLVTGISEGHNQRKLKQLAGAGDYIKTGVRLE